ncbi:MAG: metal-sensitive transcriptional regulator [Elusimicrobiota bacterium]|jgi:DNA-binding FrmR family transcriptional regulator|nr:metal-sensitive transcriptional regulator [Elusimicrobiota bacterium]
MEEITNDCNQYNQQNTDNTQQNTPVDTIVSSDINVVDSPAAKPVLGVVSHEKEISGLNRIAGQVQGVKKMIEDRRYCMDILIQLKAIRSAIKTVEYNIFSAHLDSCVANSFNNEQEKNSKFAEIKDYIAKL